VLHALAFMMELSGCGRPGCGGELNLPRDVQQVIGADVAVHLRDNGRTSLIADELGDFRVRQTALPRLGNKAGPQPVRCHVADTQLSARLGQQSPESLRVKGCMRIQCRREYQIAGRMFLHPRQ